MIKQSAIELKGRRTCSYVLDSFAWTDRLQGMIKCMNIICSKSNMQILLFENNIYYT